MKKIIQSEIVELAKLFDANITEYRGVISSITFDPRQLSEFVNEIVEHTHFETVNNVKGIIK